MKRNYLKTLGYTFIASLVLTLLRVEAAENGPLISGFHMGADASVMATEGSTGHSIEFTHDSPVPVKVYMKTPGADWVQIDSSDPAAEGHGLRYDISEDVRHAWFRVVADYSSVMDAIADNTALPPGDLPEPGSDEFVDQLTLAGYEYVEAYGNAILVERTEYSVSNTAPPTDATDNNHAMAKPDSCAQKLYWYNENNGYVYCWGLSNTGDVKGTTLSGTGAAGYQVVAKSDYDGDGLSDLVWYGVNDGKVYVWFMQEDGYCNLSGGERSGGNPDGGYAYTGQGLSGYQVVATGDFNGDSVLDLVWYSATTGKVYVWFMNTDGDGKISLVEDTGWAYTGQGLSGYQVVTSADYNADGVKDLVWYGTSSGKVYVWFMNTDGNGKISLVEDTGWAYTGQGLGGYEVVASADYNADSVKDLVWYGSSSGKVYVWFMNTDGNGKISLVEDTGWALTGTGAAGYSVGASADYNADSIIDLVWESTSSSSVYVWFMNTDGNGKISLVEDTGWTITSTKSSLASQIAASGYINDDNIVDLVWYNAVNGAVENWIMNTGGNGKCNTKGSVAGAAGYEIVASVNE